MRGRPHNKPAPGRIMWSTVEIGDVLGWPSHRVRRWLVREVSYTKHGRHYYANRIQLRRVFHEAADDIIANLPE